MDKTDFIKEIRKPLGLYTQTMKAVKEDLQGIQSLERDAKLEGLLKPDELAALNHSFLVSVCSSQAVHTHFDKSDFGLPLFGSSIYSHNYAGLGNYIMSKNG